YETTTLPRHAWLFDFAYLYSFIDKQWDGNRKGVSLIEDIRRYEPGGGLQGILRARPRAEFDFLLIQALYGVTDHLTAGVYVPIAMRSRVTTNLAWEPGDYQAQLGRQYSEEDFWQWAASMGQPRVPAQWQGGVQLSDIVLIGRYLLPEFEWMKQHHFRWSGTLLAALPTGSNFDPEEAVSVGTNLWELNAAGDVEVHLSADKAFFVDDKGLSRINVGADLFYAFLRPREYRAVTGTKNPLLNNIAPYVGEKYIVDGGDWLAGALSVDLVPFIGPSRASIVSGYSAEKAETLPPMVTLNLSYTHVRTMQKLLLVAGVALLQGCAATSLLGYSLAPDFPDDEAKGVALQLRGLQAPVTVLFDAQGVPHVEAQNLLDLARASGFVQGRARFFQMDTMRRLARGRVSELVGEQPLA
ncbi:MAG: penicillin acylase family protein, partial [Deltaproteobacteria bacterium]|nr:penicillin acylase family protein [Deltaproteobacteria bacterium]